MPRTKIKCVPTRATLNKPYYYKYIPHSPLNSYQLPCFFQVFFSSDNIFLSQARFFFPRLFELNLILDLELKLGVKLVIELELERELRLEPDHELNTAISIYLLDESLRVYLFSLLVDILTQYFCLQ